MDADEKPGLTVSIWISQVMQISSHLFGKRPSLDNFDAQ